MSASDLDLYSWQSPRQMDEAVTELGNRLGNRAMRGPGREFREAFVASRFALNQQATRVRLLRPRTEPTPDFAILLNGEEKWYEMTEADRPGRKRMDEYADDSAFASFERIPDDHWVEPEDYLTLVRNLVARKAGKTYDKCNGLIIWSNAFPIAREDVMDLPWWQEAARPGQKAFSEVWYHFRSHFGRIFNSA